MRIPTIFEKKNKENKSVISFEIFPPKKEEELKNIDETLDLLCSLNPDFISVTFGAGGGCVDNKTVEIAKKIKNNYNIEPLVHLTCLHYSKYEISEILKQIEDAGIENVLALRGDINPNIPIKNDFKYANELVEFIKSQGDFSVSGGCYPEKHIEAPDIVTDLHNLKRKVDAGVEHLVSQLFFSNEIFYDFYEKTRIAGINVPIDAGVMPVTSSSQIDRMVNMCGASMPEGLRKMLRKYEGNKAAILDAGIAYTINQIVDLIANNADGVHIYTMNNYDVAKKICSGIKNLTV